MPYQAAAADPSRWRRLVTLGVPPATAIAPQPTLYLHGADAGCIRRELVREVTDFLAPTSRAVVVAGAGHFPQLERPAEVNEHIVSWLTS